MFRARYFLSEEWRERCLYIGTFGSVIAFHFDLYSTSLSKIERGTQIDFEDVKALLMSGRIVWEKLEACYRDILPDYGMKSLRQDPAKFHRNFEILRDDYKKKGDG